MTHQKLDEFSSEEWDHTFRTNIYAMFYLSKAAFPHMKAGEHDHQHVIRAGVSADRSIARVRDDQGRHRDLHEGTFGIGDRTGNPRQRSRTRSRVDAADSFDDAR